MEFDDFVNLFKRVLGESLEQFSGEHGLRYDYFLTITYNSALFRVILWRNHEARVFFSMSIVFILESTEKGIVVKARARDKTKVIAIRRTSKKMDGLKNSIIKGMEELLEEDLKELEEKIREKIFFNRIKNIIGEYDLTMLGNAVYTKIGRSIVKIYPEYIKGNVYPGKIYIQFERKEESVIFADFVEKSISIDKTKIEVVHPRIVSINLQSFEPEERFNILKKVIEALEMMYLF